MRKIFSALLAVNIMLLGACSKNEESVFETIPLSTVGTTSETVTETTDVSETTMPEAEWVIEDGVYSYVGRNITVNLRLLTGDTPDVGVYHGFVAGRKGRGLYNSYHEYENFKMVTGDVFGYYVGDGFAVVDEAGNYVDLPSITSEEVTSFLDSTNSYEYTDDSGLLETYYKDLDLSPICIANTAFYSDDFLCLLNDAAFEEMPGSFNLCRDGYEIIGIRQEMGGVPIGTPDYYRCNLNFNYGWSDEIGGRIYGTTRDILDTWCNGTQFIRVDASYYNVEEVESGLEVIPFDECLDSLLGELEKASELSVYGRNNIYAFAAELCYIPIHALAPEDMNTFPDSTPTEYYLVPCWAVYYGNNINRSDIRNASVALINAVTGEGMYVNASY